MEEWSEKRDVKGKKSHLYSTEEKPAAPWEAYFLRTDRKKPIPSELMVNVQKQIKGLDGIFLLKINEKLKKIKYE